MRKFRALWIGCSSALALSVTAHAVDILTLDDGGTTRLRVLDSGSTWVTASGPNAALLVDQSAGGPLLRLTAGGVERLSVTMGGAVALGGDVGAAGQILTSQGAAAAARWSSLPAGVPTGTVVSFAAATAPPGWLECDGAEVSRTTHAALFAVIGTTYGAGDGSTTFDLPDMRQRFPLGRAASGTGSTLGPAGGAMDHSHSGSSHTHTFHDTVSSSTGNAGAHTHGIDPPATNTGSAGDHAHGVLTAPAQTGATSNPHFHNVPAKSQFNGSFNWVWPSHSESSPHKHPYDRPVGTAASGVHDHSLDISGFTSSSGGVHSHSLGDSTASGATSASGAGGTGPANPPFLTLTYLIKD